MNRLVLACAQFGLPSIAPTFVPLSLAFAKCHEGSERWQNEFESVACSVLGSLFLEADPEAARSLFAQSVSWARAERQQLMSRIEEMGGVFLCQGRIESAQVHDVREACETLGFYAALPLLDTLDAANALIAGDLRRSNLLFDRAGVRIALQGDEFGRLVVTYDRLVSALVGKDEAAAIGFARAAASIADRLLDHRERLAPALNERLAELAVAKHSRLVTRIGLGHDLVPKMPIVVPSFCGSLASIWINLRTLYQKSPNGEIARALKAVASRTPSLLDLESAERHMAKRAERSGVDIGGCRLTIFVR